MYLIFQAFQLCIPPGSQHRETVDPIPHHAIRAVTVVMPAVTSCSTVLLSMGMMGLPIKST